MNFRKSVTERSRESKNYYLYCINFHGSGLQTLKNVFKTQVQTGLRRPVFIIDADEIQDQQTAEIRNSTLRQSIKQSPIHQILQAIQNCCQEFDYVNRKITEELQFDIYQYWLKDIENREKASTIDAASQRDTASLNLKESGKISAKRKSKITKTTKRASRKSTISNKSSEQQEEEIACIPVVVREHNRVGQKELLSKRKYIEDNPLDGKLYIIITGQLNEEFYLDLLRYGQPILGITNFLPAEINYDLLINNTKLRSFIEETFKSINDDIYKYRQIVAMKPVGLFAHQLPILSPCMANKLQRDIFDQMTWSVYDIEMLYRQYELYYYKPFHLYNVSLPIEVDLEELKEFLESLSFQGNFQQHVLPGSCADSANIAVYLNGLLNACGPSYNGSDLELLNHSNASSSGIVKIKKFGRFFIDGGNKFLNNLLSYNKPQGVRNLRDIFLDYNSWKPYMVREHPKELELSKTMKVLEEILALPEYIKLYLSEDGCKQKLFELLETHDDIQISEIEDDCKIYTFHTTYYAIKVEEEMYVLPSRLCFRDFTLFQREEFLENLVTPEMLKASQEEARRQSLEQGGLEKKMQVLQLDEEIFIRPNSLRALKLKEKRSTDSLPPPGKEVRSSRLKSKQYDKKLSLKGDKRPSQDWVGLPPEHPLLKGYNLEDIRQEIKLKTSKYYFEQGCLELYEDKWCFQDLNQTLKFSIKERHLFLNRPRFQDGGISNNIRLEIENKINIRIVNETKANHAARIVMNYPNGLSIYYHEMYCEQIWNRDDTISNERSRIITPYGVVIVFFKSNDVVLIMRYNGEIYRLYQYDLDQGEEEDILSEFSNNQSSENIDPNGQGDYVRKKPTRIKNSSSTNISFPKISSNTTYGCEALKASVNDELKFLMYISTLYEINYVHLKITTSQGRNINLSRHGKIYEEKPFFLQEWHDYFANESYCERSDGVKMIWTQEALQCYHQDGTVITTQIEEKLCGCIPDEFDLQISESSSHNMLEEEEDNERVLKSKNPKSCSCFNFLNTESPEEHEEERFIHYICNGSTIEHRSYAGVRIRWLNPSIPNQSPVFVEIFGIDNILFYTNYKDSKEGYQQSSTVKEEPEEELHKKSNQLLVHVFIGDDLHFSADQQGFDICVHKERRSVHLNDENDIDRDSLTMRLLYEDCLTDVFKHLVNKIATFYNYNNDQIMKKRHYFVERKGKGFEFHESVPQPLDYIYNCANCILQAQALVTIDELMQHKIEHYEKNMKKFPRFRNPNSKRKCNEKIEFPIISTFSVYCKIPSQLQNTQNICQFLETFENMNFKMLQPKMNELVEFHLRPQVALEVKRRYSKNSWQKRHQEHERRKFMELQRKGLYHAMLKHHNYPNYFEFKTRYENHVRYIDFFDFLQSKCKNQEVKKEEVYWNLKPKSNYITSNVTKTKSGKSHCKYGTYDEP
ncbi:male sterile (2) 34Fe [Musca autumnalis]|uniref:male sterile (2) 34Fe n=1 Tax=Musca autumnalis TaxID=221902 RepID=UPI003CF4423B